MIGRPPGVGDDNAGEGLKAKERSQTRRKAVPICSSVKKRFLLTLVFALFLAGPLFAEGMREGEKGYYHLAIISDPHLPGKTPSAQGAAIKTINSWNDLDAVAVLGDICERTGTAAEYAYGARLFGTLTKPAYFVTGNHDYCYEDALDSRGRLVRAVPGNQEKKLKTFKETFNQAELYYSKRVGGYLLIFLSLDELGSPDLARISGNQINWLRSQLSANSALPTIIFCHAPLKGTLDNYNPYINTPNFVIQPESVIRELILQNPQVFLWVSGHTHTCPDKACYASGVNLYEKRVMDIHNCDMQHPGTFWTNSLFLYPDRVVVKTFDHGRQMWADNLQRTIRPPRTDFGGH